MVLSLTLIACQQHRNPPNAKLPKNGNDQSVKVDSIVFKTSNDHFVYLAERLFPAVELSDSMAIREVVQSDILSVEKVGDTIFVFLNNDMLHNQLNQNLPPINDSLFEHFYPKYYDVVIDVDIPYIVYLKNEKDVVQIIKSNKGIFYWETATVQDTILSFFSGVKVNMLKDEVFSLLNMPNFEFEEKDFSLILCHASIPSHIWFKQMLKSKELLESVDYGGYELNPDKPNIQILFNFKDDKLDYVYLSPWIGYGNKVGSFR